MSRLAPLLAITTLAFATSTLYFAHQLQQMHAANAADLGVPRTTTGPVRSPAPLAAPVGIAAASSAAGEFDKDESGSNASETLAGRLARARRRLSELQDPAARAQRVAGLTALFRDNWAGVAPHIGMSAEELDRFLQALVEDTLVTQQRLAECELAPACDATALRSGNSANERYARVLGPESYQRFLEYTESQPERSYVARLRERLPYGTGISDAAADKVIVALAGKRQEFVAARATSGERSLPQTAEFRPLDLILDSHGARVQPEESARRLAIATSYSRRLLESVSPLLTAQQLAEFRKMLDDELANYSLASRGPW